VAHEVQTVVIAWRGVARHTIFVLVGVLGLGVFGVGGVSWWWLGLGLGSCGWVSWAFGGRTVGDKKVPVSCV
jgi:hypothetical protein